MESIVLGVEMATASAIEQLRLQQRPEASPLADLAHPRAAAFVGSPAFRQEKLDTALRSIVQRWAQLDPEELAAPRSILSMAAALAASALGAVAVGTAGLETDESLQRFSGAFALAFP